MDVWITTLPLPPSVNEYLMPVVGRVKRNKFGKLYGQGRLVKTTVHKKYDSDVTLWVLKHSKQIEAFKEEVFMAMKAKEARKDPYALCVDMFFCFHRDRIFTVNNKLGRLDRDNRIKPMQDQLSKIIGLDDKYVFSGIAEKVSCENEEDECTILRIREFKPRTKNQILSTIDSRL